MLLQNLVQERWPGAGLVGRLALMALPTRGPGLRPWLPRATRGHQHQPAPGCCRARGPELRAASRHQQPSPSAVCAPGPLRAGGLLLDQLSAQLIQDTTRTAKCRWRKAGFGKCRPDQCQNHYLVRQESSILIHNKDHIHIWDFISTVDSKCSVFGAKTENSFCRCHVSEELKNHCNKKLKVSNKQRQDVKSRLLSEAISWNQNESQEQCRDRWKGHTIG